MSNEYQKEDLLAVLSLDVDDECTLATATLALNSLEMAKSNPILTVSCDGSPGTDFPMDPVPASEHDCLGTDRILTYTADLSGLMGACTFEVNVVVERYSGPTEMPKSASVSQNCDGP